MTYLPTSRRAARHYPAVAARPQDDLSGWFGDVFEANVEFLKLAASYSNPLAIASRLLEERRLAEAADKAKADTLRLRAEKAVADAENTARIGVERGGMAPFPPLTDAQRDLAVLLKEQQLRNRDRQTKSLLILGGLGLGGFLLWKVM